MAQQQQTRAITVAGKAQQALDEAQIDHRLLMAAKAIQLMAGQDNDGNPKITGDMAIAAAMYQAGTGQLLGRDFYVNDKVGRMEGYRGVARDANERGVGEVQIKYRPLTAQEAEWHEVQPGDTAVVCEVYQLRAWNMAQRMGQRYEPIIGIGVIRKVEKYDKKTTQRWDDGQRRYVQQPESNWRQATLEGGMTWHKKAQNRAYKDALRHTPGMSASPDEVIADAAMNLDELPPETARLTMEQAHAWVAQHGMDGDSEPDGIVEGEYVERQPEQQNGAQQASKQQAQAGDQHAMGFKSAARPWSTDNTIAALRYTAASTRNELPVNGQWGALIGLLDSAPFDTASRHALLKAVFGVDSSKDMTGQQRYALHAWAKPAKVDGVWCMDANAFAEYQSVVGLDIPDTNDPDGWQEIEAAGVTDAARF